MAEAAAMAEEERKEQIVIKQAKLAETRKSFDEAEAKRKSEVQKKWQSVTRLIQEKNLATVKQSSFTASELK